MKQGLIGKGRLGGIGRLLKILNGFGFIVIGLVGQGKDKKVPF